MSKGHVLLRSHKIDAAIKEFKQAAELAPEAEAFYWLGYSYYLKGRTGNVESRRLSRENFDSAYEADPNYSPTQAAPEMPAE